MSLVDFLLDTMSDEIAKSLENLPIEFVYRILTYLDDQTILTSFYNVSQRLNRIIESSQQYKVCWISFFSVCIYQTECFFFKKRI